MKDKKGKNFEMNIKLLIDTNKDREDLSDQWKKHKPKVDFQFEDGIIAITLPLDACSYKSLKIDD